jgi:hypothetical protein
MKKIVVAALFILLLPLSARAAGGGPIIGADAEVALPVGTLGDGAGLGFGALLRYEFTVITRANITARAGFIYHLSKDIDTPLGTFTSHFWNIPLLAGIKVAATDSLYVAGEAGLFINHSSVDGGSSDTSSKFGITVGGGYRLSSLDLRVGLGILDLGHAGDTIELFANLGYNF